MVDVIIKHFDIKKVVSKRPGRWKPSCLRKEQKPLQIFRCTGAFSRSNIFSRYYKYFQKCFCSQMFERFPSPTVSHFHVSQFWPTHFSWFSINASSQSILKHFMTHKLWDLNKYCCFNTRELRYWINIEYLISFLFSRMNLPRSFSTFAYRWKYPHLHLHLVFQKDKEQRIAWTFSQTSYPILRKLILIWM